MKKTKGRYLAFSARNLFWRTKRSCNCVLNITRIHQTTNFQFVIPKFAFHELIQLYYKLIYSWIFLHEWRILHHISAKHLLQFSHNSAFRCLCSTHSKRVQTQRRTKRSLWPCVANFWATFFVQQLQRRENKLLSTVQSNKSPHHIKPYSVHSVDFLSGIQQSPSTQS